MPARPPLALRGLCVALVAAQTCASAGWSASTFRRFQRARTGVWAWHGTLLDCQTGTTVATVRGVEVVRGAGSGNASDFGGLLAPRNGTAVAHRARARSEAVRAWSSEPSIRGVGGGSLKARYDAAPQRYGLAHVLLDDDRYALSAQLLLPSNGTAAAAQFASGRTELDGDEALLSVAVGVEAHARAKRRRSMRPIVNVGPFKLGGDGAPLPPPVREEYAYGIARFGRGAGRATYRRFGPGPWWYAGGRRPCALELRGRRIRSLKDAPDGFEDLAQAVLEAQAHEEQQQQHAEDEEQQQQQEGA